MAFLCISYGSWTWCPQYHPKYTKCSLTCNKVAWHFSTSVVFNSIIYSSSWCSGHKTHKKNTETWKVGPRMSVLGLCETALEQAIFGLQRHGIFQVPYLGRDGNPQFWSSLVPKKGPLLFLFSTGTLGRLKNTNASTRSCEITKPEKTWMSRLAICRV